MQTRLHRRSERGFSLIELMVVVAVIAIISAIAMPNFQRAMRETRRKTAYSAAIKISHAIEMHASSQEAPPPYKRFPLRTMQPLVDSQSLTKGEALSLLARFEGDQLDGYITWPASGWNLGSEGGYIAYFRPQGEPDADCYIWNRWGRCWYPDEGVEYFTGQWAYY